jgi:hypothetical protein
MFYLFILVRAGSSTTTTPYKNETAIKDEIDNDDVKELKAIAKHIFDGNKENIFGKTSATTATFASISSSLSTPPTTLKQEDDLFVKQDDDNSTSLITSAVTSGFQKQKAKSVCVCIIQI